MKRPPIHDPEQNGYAAVLDAALFASEKHSRQRRKDALASPYVNHPIAVTAILTRTAGVRDPAILQAALLHDVIEDTATTGDELEARFGRRVRALVEEVTDDHALPQAERKRRQIETAPSLSPHAKLIRLADKIANLGDLTLQDPPAWSTTRKLEYLAWAEQVAAGCHGAHPALEAAFREVVLAKRQMLAAPLDAAEPPPPPQ